MELSFVLMVVATVCLFLAAFSVTVSRVSVGWLGLALWALATLV